MARGWHYTKLSLSSALLSFSDVCFALLKEKIVPLFLSFCFVFCFTSIYALVGAL